LTANGIPHSKVNIESVEGAADKLVNETGKRAIPYILVNGKHWVRGYHKELPSRFSSEQLMKDLAEAADS
jgi:glutaredoxin